MSSLGELFFSLGLDSQKFDEAIKKAKEKVAELTGEASITINADASNVAAQVQDDLNKITGKKTEIKLGIDKSSKASVEDLVKDIANAEKELERLKSKESWNTAAIGRQEGFVANLKRQLEEAKAVKVAATEAKEAIKETAESTQTIQHVVREEDINLVQRMTSALEKQNEQLELRNRLDQGKIDAAKKNKAEQEEKKRIKAEQKAIEKALKEEEKNRKAQEKAAEKAIKDAEKKEKAEIRAAEKEEKARFRRMEKEAKAIQKQQIAEQKIFEGRKKLQEDREREEGELIAKRRNISADWLNKTRTQNEKQRKTEITDSRNELQEQLRQLFRLEQAIKRLNYVKVDLDTSDVDKDSEDYKKAAKALDNYIDKLKELQGSGKKLNANEVSDVIGIDMSRLVEQVKKASKGQKKLKEEVEETSEAMKDTSNWASQLSNQIADVFSVYSAERFIRSLYTIGGEFQKQQIALQNMIGDATKAGSIFERIKGLAVKSPFTFSELASYTKQMSAYGIEYNELYDTTKRLADISAGVGVDMGRLILAYGQVRSAEVLRGQELRQFTEAGIPLVEELAKRLSEVRNQSVRVGEVFDAISKRQVPFEMVKDVLFDFTDPGGRFFETQEKLAESLAGKWSNLKDAWEIMVAGIAQDNHGALAGAIDLLTNLTRQWKIFVPLIYSAATAIGVYQVAVMLATRTTSSFMLALKAHPAIAFVSALAGVAAVVHSYASSIDDVEEKTRKLNEELETNIQNHKDNEATAVRYLKTLKSQNTSEEQRVKLYKELSRMYPSIFPEMEMEKTLLEDLIVLKEKLAGATKANTEAEYNESVATARKNEAAAKFILDHTPKTKRMPIYNADGTTSYMDVEDLTEYNKAAEEWEKAKTAVVEAEQKRSEFLEELKRYNDKKAFEDATGWRQKAKDALGKRTDIQAPKEAQLIDEYFEYLENEFKDASSKYERYAEKSLKEPQMEYMKAIDAVNKAIGGLTLFDRKPTDEQKEKERLAKEKAKNDIDAYVEAVKNEAERVSEKWSLFKELADATGDKGLAMKIAFDGKTVAFESELEWLKHRIQEEAKKANINMSVSDLLGLGEKQLLDKGVEEKVAKSIGHLIEIYNKSNKKLSVDTVKEFAEIIKASRNFEEQIAAIDAKLQEDLANLRVVYKDNPTALNFAEAEAKKRAEEEKTKVNFEEFKKSSDWVKVFDDLDRVSDATLDNMIFKIEEFAKQAHLSEEVTKQLVEAVRKLKDEKIERNPFSVFSANISNELSMAKKAIDGYKKAIKTAKEEGNTELVLKLEEKKANQEDKVRDIYENYDVAMNEALKKISDFASSVSEVSSLLEQFGNTSLKNFSEYLNGISGGMQSGYNAGSLFGAAGGVIGGFIGAATGAMSGLVEAGRKAVDAEQERSQIVIDRLDKVASILKDRIANSLTGLYNSTLDATSRLEMQQQKEKYDTAEKYFKDKGITIKPDSSYIASINSPTFSWDKEEYLLYSQKAHDAINKALEEDNEYMAMYASMLIQRDEMMSQMATYTDKDSDKVEQYKRDKKIEIEKLDMEIEQLSKDMLSSLYSVDFNDWSKQITDSIVGAWSKGEDAAKAYENTVSSIMRNVAANMIQQKIIGDYLEKNIKPLVDEFIGKNGVMDEELFSTLTGIVEGVGEKTKDVQNFLDNLEKIMNEKGLTLKDMSESSSSGGLSKGIQSITEDTAGLLASYLNATRQDVSIQRTLVEQLVSVDVPKMSIIAQAQLQQLQQVAANTRRNADAADRIYELVNKVVDRGGNKLRI